MTNRDRVLFRMPARMQDLLVEVQCLKLHGVSQPALHAILRSDLAVRRQRTTDLLRLERGFVRLQHHVVERVDVEYPQVVVIRSREHMSIPSRQDQQQHHATPHNISTAKSGHS